MRLGPWFLTIVTVLAGLSLPGVARAQVAPTDNTPTAPAIKEAKPELFYLKDKNGQLTPVPGFTLEDFERLLERDRSRTAAPQRPPFRLDKLSATGTVDARQATLKLTFTVLVDSEDWVRVPLRLNDVVVDAPKYEGPGKHALEFDEKANEYVLWLHGRSELPHQLVVQIVAPLIASHDEHRLRLSVPRAWSSSLKMTIAGDVIPQASGGAILDSVRNVDSATEVNVLGWGGDFSLGWRSSLDLQRTQAIEASGLVQTRVSPRGIQTQAQLTVRSVVGDLSSFQVKLPPGARWQAVDVPGMTIVPIEPADPARGDQRTILQVTLLARTNTPVILTLLTERPIDEPSASSIFELGGFEVPGAIRQGGFMTLQVDDAWQAVWNEQRAVRQIDTWPPDLPRTGILAGFEYVAQPFSLTLKLSERQPHLSVSPRYRLTLERDRLQLEVSGLYRARGGRVSAIGWKLNGWQFDELDSQRGATADNGHTIQNDELRAPLKLSQIGEFETVFRARRAFDSEQNSLNVLLPWPTAQEVRSGDLVIQSDGQFELRPRYDESVGLTPRWNDRPDTSPAPTPAIEFQTSALPPRLIADVRRTAKGIAVEAVTTATVQQGVAQVISKLTYRPQNDRVDVLALKADRTLWESEGWSISLNGQSVPVSLERRETQEQNLTVARLGVASPSSTEPLVVELRYRWTLDGSGESAQTLLPLVLPLDALVTEHRFHLRAIGNAHGSVADSAWQALVPPQTTNSTEDHVWSATGSPLRITLKFDTDETQRQSIHVERYWAQTILAPHRQVSRVAYVLSSRAARLSWALPTAVNGCELFIDGERVPCELSSDHHVSVLRAPDNGPWESSRIELRLSCDDSRGISLSQRVWLPQLIGHVQFQRGFSEVILPGADHLWSVESQLNEENRWQWDGLAWGRYPRLSESELTDWAQAIEEPGWGQGGHRYLFTLTEPLASWELQSFRRSTLTISVAVLVLLVSLVGLRTTVLRHPWARLSLAGVVVTWGVIFPGAALLALQAALVAVIPGAAAVAFRNRRQRRIAQIFGARSHLSRELERGSTVTQAPNKGVKIGTGSTAALMAVERPASASNGGV